MKLYSAHVLCTATTTAVVFATSSACASDPKELVEDSGSPSGQYALAVLALDKEERKRDEAGRLEDQSLFLVDMRSKRKLVEISESFRRPSSSPYPRYEAAWSVDDFHVAAVARFRRNSAILAYEKEGETWKRIALPTFDAFDYARLRLTAEPGATGQSEITKVEWKGNMSLAVRAVAYLKSPRVVEMQINYSYFRTNGKWRLKIESSKVESE